MKNTWVTLTEAQTALKFTGDSSGRRFKRMLEAREGQDGIKLIHRTSGGHARVYIDEIKRACPELNRAELARGGRELAAFMETIRDEVTDEVRGLIEHHIAATEQRLERRIRQLEEMFPRKFNQT